MKMRIDKHMEFTDKLFPHQIEAIEMLEKYIKSTSKKHALVKLPTGTGKTVVISYICNCFKKFKNILVVSPSKGVTEQLKRELEAGIKEKLELTMQFKEVEHIYPSNIEDLVKTKGNTVFVTTIKSINDIRENNPIYFEKLKNKIDILIFDEGHREPAKVWQKTIRDFGKKVVLLTATPVRNDDNNFNLEKKYIYNYAFHKAIEDKAIREVTFKAYDGEGDLEDFIQYIYCVYNEFSNKYSDEIRVIIRFDNAEDIIEAKKILEAFTDKVVAIHQTFKTDVNQKKYKNVPNTQEIPAVFWLHQNKLIEGIDDTKFSILAIYNSFSDVRSLVQQVGRIVRKNSIINESLVVYKKDGIDQDKMFKEFLHYEKRLEGNLSLITFNFDDFFNKVLSNHPPVLHINKRFLERVDYLKKELDVELLNSFQLPLKTNIYSTKVTFSLREFERICKNIIDNIIVNEKGKIIYELQSNEEFNLVVIYSIYKNSPYLINNYFIEPKLGITVVKLEGDFLFYYDSNNMVCSEITAYTEKTSSEFLQKLFDDKSEFKQLTINNGYVVDNNIRRQVVFTEDMNNVAPSITDKYKFCTTIYGTVKEDKNPQRTRYVGFSNSRVSDSSHLFRLNTYMSWLNHLSLQLNNGNAKNRIFDRYAPVTNVPTETDPINILFNIDKKQRESIVGSLRERMYWEKLVYDIKENQFEISFNEQVYKIKISYDSVNGKYNLQKVDERYLGIESISGTKDLMEYLNQEQNFQVLTKNCDSVYLKGNFYKLGIETFDDRLDEILIEYKSLKEIINEKGKADKPENQKDNWDDNSLFYILSSLGGNLDKENSGSAEIYKALNQMDYLICTDLGKEIADFIGLDEENDCVYFIHCKASDTSLSASAFQDVCGQIIKNLDYVNPLGTRIPKDIEKWNGEWDVSKYNVVKNRMIRNKDSLSPQEIWEKIKRISIKQNANIYVWALLGNMFSKQKYLNEKQRGSNQKPEIIQIDYLLMSTWSAVQNSNAQLKIYFDKK
ncbi:DEAD/DEAH box helicase (plasmid) [Bacillus mycoides]|nr:DEAD/DEAH box helicase [Bacillus mycoides]